MKLVLQSIFVIAIGCKYTCSGATAPALVVGTTEVAPLSQPELTTAGVNDTNPYNVTTNMGVLNVANRTVPNGSAQGQSRNITDINPGINIRIIDTGFTKLIQDFISRMINLFRGNSSLSNTALGNLFSGNPAPNTSISSNPAPDTLSPSNPAPGNSSSSNTASGSMGGNFLGAGPTDQDEASSNITTPGGTQP